MPAACRRRADALFERARSTENAFERLALVLDALEWEARATILEEEAALRCLDHSRRGPRSAGS